MSEYKCLVRFIASDYCISYRGEPENLSMIFIFWEKFELLCFHYFYKSREKFFQ